MNWKLYSTVNLPRVLNQTIESLGIFFKKKVSESSSQNENPLRFKGCILKQLSQYNTSIFREFCSCCRYSTWKCIHRTHFSLVVSTEAAAEHVVWRYSKNAGGPWTIFQEKNIKPIQVGSPRIYDGDGFWTTRLRVTTERWWRWGWNDAWNLMDSPQSLADVGDSAHLKHWT